MPVVKNLMVRAGADFSAITKQSKKAQESMHGMQSSISRSCSKISAAVGGIKKVFSALGVAVSFAAITSAAKDAKKAYDAQAGAEAKLAQVMRNTMGAASDEIASIKALCSAQQELGVIGDEVQLAGAQELATYLTMSSTLKTLIPVMNDMAAQQYGLSASAENVTAIATMLGKVMNGQTSALSRYGYTFTAAQEAVLKYGDEAQRAAVLAQVVGESVGGMNAALAATPSGRLQQVSNTLGDIKEGFGSAVSTVLTVFLPALNTVCSVLASMATLANKVAQSIANVFGGGTKSAATAVSYTGAAASAMGELGEETKEAGEAAASLGTYGFDTLQKMSGTSGSGGGPAGDDAGEMGGAGGGIVETSAEMEEAGESVGWLERALNRLKETAEKIDLSKLTDALDRLKTAAEPLSEALFSGLSWAYENVFEPLAQWTVEDALPGFLNILADSAAACVEPLSGLGTALQPLVSSAFEGLKWGYENILLPLGSWVGTQALPAFLDVLSGACELFSSVLDRLKPLGQWLWDNLLAPIASWSGGYFVATLQLIAGLFDLLAGVISGNISLWDALGAAAGLAVDFIKAVFGPIVSWLDTNVIQPVAGFFSGLWGGIKTVAGTAWDGIVGIWTTVSTWFDTNVIQPTAEFFDGLWDGIKLVAGTAWDGIVGIWTAVSTWFDTNVIQPTAEFFDGLWDGIKLAAGTAWDGIVGIWTAVSTWFDTNVIQPTAEFFDGLWDGIKLAAGTAWDGIVGVWTAVSTWFDTNVIQPVAGFFSGLWSGIKLAAGTARGGIVGIWTTVSTWFNTNVTQPVAGFFNGLWNGITTTASSAWTGIKNVWQAAGNWFSKNVTTPISNGFKGFANGILGFFEGLANGAINAVNTITRALNTISFDIPEWVPLIGGNKFGFNFGTIAPVALPRLANGAVFQGNDPYLAVVNDQKHGVNVETPLTTMIEAMMTALRSVDLLGDIQVDVRAVFDGQLAALARLLRPYFEADAKRVGNRASTAKGAI